MKNRLLGIIIALPLCLMLLSVTALALEGEGSESSPYLIKSASDMIEVRDTVNNNPNTGGYPYKNKYLKLMNDITLDNWTPIGYYNANYEHLNSFWGNFDGNGHTITLTNYNKEDQSYQGVFGVIYGTPNNGRATIKNLNVSGSISVGGYSGGVVGLNKGGTVENCSFSGTVSATTSSVGGVVGSNTGTVKNCYHYNGNVSSTNFSSIGGVVGNNTGTVENCYNIGQVTGAGNDVGGVVGSNGNNQYGGTVRNCYHFNGDVSGVSNVGGVVGANKKGTVSSSYHFGGSITGDSNVGGVAGSNSSTVDNCYYHSGMAETGIGSGSGSAASKTIDQFHSGEVTWLLNGSTNSGTPVWYQNIEINRDIYPLLTSESKRVYASSPCPTKFSNTSGQTENHATGSYTASGAEIHEVCQNCGATGGTATLALKSGADLTYTGSPIEPCTVTCSDGWSSGPLDVSYSNNTNAGTATASISLGGVNASTTFEIKKATVTVTPTSGQTKVYGTADPALTYTSSGQVSGETPAFTGALSRAAGETAGTYAIKIGSLALTDNGAFKASNYKLALSSTPVYFTITKAASALTIAADQSVVYDGAAVTAGTSGADVIYAYNGDGQVTVKWYADSNGTKGSEISAPNTVGTYWIGVSAAAGTNYSAASEKTQKFTITKKPLTITAKPQTITYGGSIATTTNQVTVETLATGDTLDSITLTPSTENVPGGTITPSAAIIKDGATDVTGCYEITYRTGTLTVKKAGQDKPAAPTAKAGATTATRIELDPITTTGIGAVQYACSTTSTAPTGEDAWQASPVFADLVKNTPYYFFARYAGDANHDPAVSTGTRIRTLNTYTITYDLNGGSGTTPTAQTQDVGTDFTAAEQGDIARTGYTFLGWAKTANAASAAYAAGAAVSGITADDTLYAVWKINQYTITFDTDGGSEIAPITKDYNSAVTAPAAPKKTGHSFASWEPDIPLKMPAENMTVKATWTPDVYTVTLDPNKGTIQEGNVTEYTYGVGATLPTKVTRGGYHFAGWYDNKDCKGKPVTAISTTDIGEKTFYAAWSYISPTTYPPTVTRPDEGGSVTVSPKNPEKGDKVTITPKPEKGYEVDQVIVTDKNGKPIAVRDNGNGTFSFTQPAGKVNVKVTFKDNTPVSFVDVPSGAYYETAVLWAAENGITGGTDATHFSPNAPCTRAQIVTFLWRAAGCPEPESLSSLSDVPADAYYAKAVAWAVENGITTGTGNSTFNPNATCTRAQAMAFIYRSEQARGGGMQGEWMFRNPFDDVNLESYYGEAVMWAVANGVTGGTTATTFSPNANCTRAQIVTFLYRNAK